MDKFSNHVDQIRQLISKGELNTALQQLNPLFQNSPKLDEIIQHAARFRNIQKQIRLGVISPENAAISKNQISASLLELLRETDRSREKYDDFKEAEKAEAKKPSNIQKAEKIYNIEKIDKADFS